MLNETYYWSIPFGRWNGIPIRLHMLIFLAAAIIFGIEFHLLEERPAMLGTAISTVLIGALVIGIHVASQMLMLAHCRRGIKAICIVPWGAIYHFTREVPANARSQALAFGIVANALALVISLLILAPGSPESIWNMVHPFSPRQMDWNNIDRSLLEIFTWLNFALTMATLIPIPPFDNGYLLEAWSDRKLADVDPIQRFTMLFAIGMLFSIGMFFLAYFVRDWAEGPLRPAWLWPVMLGTVLFFAARQHYQRRLHEYLPRSEFGWEMTAVPTQSFVVEEDFEEPTFSLDSAWNEMEADIEWEDWMKENQVSRSEAVIEQEKTEDDLLDQILHKVGESGLESLTKDEKDLLHRVSQRYRSRQQLS